MCIYSYFIAAIPSIDRHLYGATLPTSTSANDYEQESPFALTRADDSGYFAVKFSPETGYYVLSYSGPDVPWTKVLQTMNDSKYSPRKFRIPSDIV